jgi:hypothetical protein
MILFFEIHLIVYHMYANKLRDNLTADNTYEKCIFLLPIKSKI